MSKRIGWIALAAATLVMIGTAAPASARKIVRYNAAARIHTASIQTCP